MTASDQRTSLPVDVRAVGGTAGGTPPVPDDIATDHPQPSTRNLLRHGLDWITTGDIVICSDKGDVSSTRT